MMKFTDGVNVNTQGDLRPLRLHDGWYVVGKGMMIPVADRDEAQRVIEDMKGVR
jgi:hypothetical protein